METAVETRHRMRLEPGPPAGIVFHATESGQARFAPENNEDLMRLGESVVEYVRRRRCYHYLIDRFGRVHRIVAESDAADHAGHSVWASGGHVFRQLNESFLGVAFEARGGGEPLTAAQTTSGRALVEMLRSRYGIAAENCVTHAQVSVNPRNRRVGYHTDWISGFPFDAMGLGNNYRLAPAAIRHGGYRCDPGYLRQADPELRAAALAEQAHSLQGAVQ